MFRSRRPLVRVSGVPSGVVQWICVVPRNHHDENRTMSNSAGAGPEPPRGCPVFNDIILLHLITMFAD